MSRGLRRIGWSSAAVAVVVVLGTSPASQTVSQTASQRLDYPQTRKVDHVDTYHLTSVPDPYRWLEDDNSPETAQWVAAENKVTFGYLEKIPYRAQLKARLETLFNYPKFSAPARKGDYFFFSKNDGLQNQSVLYIQKGLSGTPEVLIDPNKWSEDGTTRLAAFSLSKDGKYAVVGVSRSGSDWQEYGVMEIATKTMLPDKIEWVKVSGASWRGNGFYYSRYPAPAKGRELSSANENHQVYFHKVGTPQSADELSSRTRPIPTVPRGRHDRRRAVRHPGSVGPRQGQEGERGVRQGPVEERDGVPSPDRHDRRRLVQRDR